MSHLVVLAAVSGVLCHPGDLAAQNLVITNARIVTGAGTVLERGSIVVRDGRIVSVAAGGTSVTAVQTIDARGMTALPGFIDAHRHIMTGNDDRWFKEQSIDRMREFLRGLSPPDVSIRTTSGPKMSRAHRCATTNDEVDV